MKSTDAVPSADRRAARERARQLGFLQAINQAQTEEMARDERVILMGQDLRANVFGAAAGVLERFGPSRVRDLPLSEAGSVGVAAGAAMAGLRPIVDLTVASFVFGAMDQFVSQLAKARYMFGGQATLPVVIRAALYLSYNRSAEYRDLVLRWMRTYAGTMMAVPNATREERTVTAPPPAPAPPAPSPAAPAPPSTSTPVPATTTTPVPTTTTTAPSPTQGSAGSM